MPRKAIYNEISTIHPYKSGQSWVFDDEARGLSGEALVGGMPEIIMWAAARYKIANPEKGITVIFSGKPFPGSQFSLRNVTTEVKQQQGHSQVSTYGSTINPMAAFFEAVEGEEPWEFVPGPPPEDDDGTSMKIYGNFYALNLDGQQIIGYLCPALYLYFKEAPKTLYIQIAR